MSLSGAACYGMDSAVFVNPQTPETVRIALDTCRRCPVISECADYHTEVEKTVGGPAVGVWAGVHWVEQSKTDHRHAIAGSRQ